MVRFAHHDRSTPAPFCLTCKRRIPTITADLGAHGWPDDVSRIKHHFLTPFGARPLSWIATDEGARALRTWAVGLRTHTAKRDKKPLGTRTVWNVFYAVKVPLDQAVELERLERNPLATFRADKYLPAKSDKGPRSAGFELEQVVSLTTDQRLCPPRCGVSSVSPRWRPVTTSVPRVVRPQPCPPGSSATDACNVCKVGDRLGSTYRYIPIHSSRSHDCRTYLAR